MIQIAAVRFNPVTRQIDHNFFNGCLEIPPTRFWDEDTRSWWMKQNRSVLESIYARMRDPAEVMRDFWDWCGGVECRMAFLSKPLSFDFPFVASYFREFGPGRMPFDFRLGRDLRSVLVGLTFPGPSFDDRSVPMQGPAHDALFDCLHQINVLFKAMDHAKGPEILTV